MKQLLLLTFFLFSVFAKAQNSVARMWNEMQLKTIRQDFARPPVQARNLFHVSAAMYDAWAAYDAAAQTYLLGKTVNGIYYPYTGIPTVAPAQVDSYRNIAVSYAAYRVLKHRYANSNNPVAANARFDSLMLALNLDKNFTAVNYASGNPAELGNYIGQQIIAMGLADSAREAFNYSNLHYLPTNGALSVFSSGASNFSNVAHWQPLNIPGALDQNNNPIPSIQTFLSPEWGNVAPFSLSPSNCVHYFRDGGEYPVYFNPPAPPQLNLTDVNDSMSQLFKWGHSMVAVWSSHHTPDDTTMIDISPNGKGNNAFYPADFVTQQNAYDYFNGGDYSPGYTLNPVTGLPYTPQLVKRGDYTRVVSQFWADGPASETPPGHWFVLFNEASDDPLMVKKFEGQGPTLNNLEWDVKSYFALGGAMHDAAVACWGIKGWYDSPRPISAIRKMAELGQSSDSTLPSYHPGGLPLIPGYIELIQAGDPLAGFNNFNVNKIKLKAWKGFDPIIDPNTDYAGVGWILGINWMPYQRKTFITPPFAGYTSGHSTYSRAAAEMLTLITGSEYFPGGLHEFTVDSNSHFLVFEKGPSMPIKLQWAKYRDASDQSSLSRIWGSIHPPFDDMNGRLIGAQIAQSSFNLAKSLFTNIVLGSNVSSFKAVENNCHAEINWQAKNESGVLGYDLLKSTDGLNYNQHLASFDAGNNTTQSYSFSDPLKESHNFYRLVERLSNGQQQIVSSTYVDASKCFELSSLQVSALYPNPSSDMFNVDVFSSNNQEPLEVKIFSLDGRLVFNRTMQMLYGKNILSFNCAHYAAGTYVVYLTGQNGFAKSLNLIKK